MKCLVKVKTQIFKCTGLMPSDLGNPYIHSATALCDTWDLSLGIETLEEVHRKGYNTGRVVRRLTYVRIHTMGGSVRSLHRECTDSLRDVVMRSV